jgi:hypothetical protein
LTARHALLVPPNPGLDPVYIDGMIDIMVIGNAIEVARDMRSTCCCRALRGMFSQTINFGRKRVLIGSTLLPVDDAGHQLQVSCLIKACRI